MAKNFKAVKGRKLKSTNSTLCTWIIKEKQQDTTAEIQSTIDFFSCLVIGWGSGAVDQIKIPIYSLLQPHCSRKLSGRFEFMRSFSFSYTMEPRIMKNSFLLAIKKSKHSLHFKPLPISFFTEKIGIMVKLRLC